jgi:hypothetical protein
MLAPRKPLELCRGDNLSIDNQRGRRIVVERGNT